MLHSCEGFGASQKLTGTVSPKLQGAADPKAHSRSTAMSYPVHRELVCSGTACATPAFSHVSNTVGRCIGVMDPFEFVIACPRQWWEHCRPVWFFVDLCTRWSCTRTFAGTSGGSCWASSSFLFCAIYNFGKTLYWADWRFNLPVLRSMFFSD